MHPRSWAYDKMPRIITKFFSAEGGFVGDYGAAYLPVTGHLWRPKSVLTECDNEALSTDDILAAYVAFLNSAPFVKLLALYAPHVAGGQFDLSLRHVGPIFLPNFRELSLDPDRGRLVSALATLGKAIDLSEPAWRAKTLQMVTELYGARILEDL